MDSSHGPHDISWHFAHEFFHFYRRRIAVARALATRDAGLEELLGYPAEEGIADQLDKRAYANASDSAFASMMRAPGAAAWAPAYRDAYRRSAEYLAKVSAALERSAMAPDSANAIAATTRDSLPDGGRALGAFMAHAIDTTLGRAALIDVAGDPFAFWLAYDRAARQSRQPLPRMSEAALNVVRRLYSAR